MAGYLQEFVFDFWAVVSAMSPYLLFGFLVAGILSVLVSQEIVERHLGGRGVWPLVKASVFGVPLPLCSCGVIPVSMSLHKHGASKGSTISFLLSTPQTGVDSIFVTFSLLGPVIAVFRPLVAFATGIFGGVLVDVFDRQAGELAAAPRKCTAECCGGGSNKKKVGRALKYGFVTLPADIGRPMLVGLVIAAGISVFLPDDFFAGRLLGHSVLQKVVMMLVGIPVYVCATASVPVAAALIAKGISPGAAMVFLITGPATNAAAFTTIWKVLGRRAATAYIITVVICALGFGLLLDTLFPELGKGVQAHMGHTHQSVVAYMSAVILLAVLSFAILRPKKETESTS